MNWNFLITFGIGIGVYLIVLGIIALVKYQRNKKRLDKEVKEDEQSKESK